jgi:hypothetical protein
MRNKIFVFWFAHCKTKLNELFVALSTQNDYSVQDLTFIGESPRKILFTSCNSFRHQLIDLQMNQRRMPMTMSIKSVPDIFIRMVNFLLYYFLSDVNNRNK